MKAKPNDTAMGAAFMDAGYEGPTNRLARIVADALKRFPKHFEAARNFVFGQVSTDARLLVELVGDETIRKRIDELLRAPRAEDQNASEGLLTAASNGHRIDAPSRSEPKPGASSGDGQGDFASNGHFQDAVANFRPAGTPLGAQVILGPLQREIIVAGGHKIPLGDARAGDVRMYSKLLGFRAAWMDRLVIGLTDEMVVGDHRSDADAEKAMAETRKALAHV